MVVIDALGSPALARELMAEIRRVSGKNVTHVILTHYHADHIYGLQVFKDALIAKKAADERRKAYVEGWEAEQKIMQEQDELSSKFFADQAKREEKAAADRERAMAMVAEIRPIRKVTQMASKIGRAHV